MRIAILIATMIISISCVAGERCPVAGEAMHWAADYCMYKNETDDFHNQQVQECFNEQKLEGNDECELKKKYKEKMCEMMKPYYQGSFEKCINDKTFSGSTVKNGGV